MDDKAPYIREQFPDKTLAIDLLMAQDPEFRAMCEDYDACVNAFRYWAKSGEPEAEIRVREYRALIRELKEEVAEALVAPKPRRLD